MPEIIIGIPEAQAVINYGIFSALVISLLFNISQALAIAVIPLEILKAPVAA
jgi:hypothetical protein